MRHGLVILLFLAFGGCQRPRPALRPARDPVPWSWLVVEVRNTATGAPLQRAFLTLRQPADSTGAAWGATGTPDADGRVWLSRYPARAAQVTVACQPEGSVGQARFTPRVLLEHQIAGYAVLPAGGAAAVVDTVRMAVDASGCDARPLVRVIGTFEGYYGANGHHTGPMLIGRGFSTPAVVRWSPAAWRTFLQKAGREDDVHPSGCWWVRVQGTRTGESAYGYFGMYRYLVQFERLHTVRPAPDSTCY